MSASNVFFLKTAVLARALAELTVLLILVILPLLLLFFGQFSKLHLIMKTGVCLLSPLSLFAVFEISKIPFRLELSESGLSGRSLARRVSLEWKEILSLKQTNHLGWKQYVLVHGKGELSFPCFMNRANELVNLIRSRLPNRGRVTAGDAPSFVLPKSAFVYELAKLCLQGGFVALFICFTDSLSRSSKTSQVDLAIVALAAGAFSLSVVWRLVQVLRLPRRIDLDREFLHLCGPCMKVRIAWTEIRTCSPSGLLYPDGIMLGTQKKTYLISGDTDNFDELCEEISARRSKPQLKSDTSS